MIGGEDFLISLRLLTVLKHIVYRIETPIKICLYGDILEEYWFFAQEMKRTILSNTAWSIISNFHPLIAKHHPINVFSV